MCHQLVYRNNTKKLKHGRKQKGRGRNGSNNTKKLKLDECHIIVRDGRE